jgi:hypothetical protein
VVGVAVGSVPVGVGLAVGRVPVGVAGRAVAVASKPPLLLYTPQMQLFSMQPGGVGVGVGVGDIVDAGWGVFDGFGVGVPGVGVPGVAVGIAVSVGIGVLVNAGVTTAGVGLSGRQKLSQLRLTARVRQVASLATWLLGTSVVHSTGSLAPLPHATKDIDAVAPAMHMTITRPHRATLICKLRISPPAFS